MLINKNSQHVTEEMKDRFYEDFNISFDLKLPKEKSENVVFSLGMRIKSPYLQSPDEGYVNPQTNMGTKQYILDFYGNGKLVLRKTESIMADYKWRIVTTDDGKKLAVPGGIPCVLDTVFGSIFENMSVHVSLVYNHFIVKINDKIVVDTKDELPYPSGYISFKSFDYDIEINNVVVSEINEKVSVKEFKPTALFLKGNPPKRVGELILFNECEAPRECYISVNDNVQALGIIPDGESSHEIEIPDNKNEGTLAIKVFKDGAIKESDIYITQLKPARKRTLWMTFTAHEDLGYCGWLDKLKEEMAIYLDMAQDLCDKDERYKYMIEHMWWFLGYSEVRTPEKMKSLIDNYIKKGKIEPLFTHSGTHTYWNRFEQMVRSTNFARIEAKEKYGIDSVTGVYADTNGMAWQAAQSFAKAGCKYLLNVKGPWRYPKKQGTKNEFYHNPQNTFPYYEPDLSGIDGLCYWAGPNEKDKILLYTAWSYGGDRKGTFAVYKGYHEYKKFIIDNLNFRSDYPYDDMLEPCYTDHLMPNDANTDLINRFEQKYEYPKIKICTLREYFEHMEENYKDKIPTIKGEIGSTWGDYATIDPESFTKKIEVAQGISFIEKLCLMAKNMGINISYPYKEIYDMLWRSLEFDEHCWATMLPPTPDNVFNNDIAKKGTISYAYEECQSIIKGLTLEISKELSNNGIVVFNTLSFKTTQTVKIDVSNIDYFFELLDNGEKIPYSKIGNEITFEVKMAAYSVKVLEISECKSEKVALNFNNSIIDTQFYKITIENNSIYSIFDKELDVELIDKNAPHGFNSLLYIYAEDYLSPKIDIFENTIENVEVKEFETLFEIIQTGIEKESKTKIENKIYIYKNMKKIDFKNRIYDAGKLLYEGCMGRYYGDIGNRYMDNFFYSFPLNVPNFEFKIELQGCEADYQKDYVRAGVKDYVMLQNYIAAQNSDYEITLFNKNTPCAHLGEIRYNHFNIENIPQKSHIYSYVVSSRMSGLHTRSIEDCDLTFEFSLMSGKSLDRQKTAWEIREPLYGVVCKNGEANKDSKALNSLINIDNENIVATAVKFAERIGDGVVIRLLNTKNNLQTANVNIDFMDVEKSYLITANEEIIKEIDFKDISLDGYDYINILLKSRYNLNAPTNLDIIAGDNYTGISWDGNGENLRNGEYFIFRSIEKDFKQSQYNMVGQTFENEFTDTALSMGKTYYYKIGAVDNYNNAIFSDEFEIKTTKENISPPSPLTEIRVSVIDLHSLALTFKTSKEDDIVSYEILRGENLDDLKVIDKIEASKFYLQFYKDTNLKQNTVYYYQVLSIDNNGNKAKKSPVASKKTPATDWWIVRSYKGKYIKEEKRK